MTDNLNTRKQTELNDNELNLLVGGVDYPTAVDPAVLAVAEKLSAIQPIHLVTPLPPVHTAVPH